MDSAKWDATVDQARVRIAEMDRIDRANGRKEPISMTPNTAIGAIAAAMMMATQSRGGVLLSDVALSCIADAVIYLEQIGAALNQK